jgi:putative FmdB family regulatory protein
MPIYEYECKACGYRLEKLQKISAVPLTDCPACAASALDRLVSAAGFRLAGGGWYETDFKADGRKNLAGDAGAEKPTDNKKDDAKATPSQDGKVAAKKPGDTSTAVKKDGSVA